MALPIHNIEQPPGIVFATFKHKRDNNPVRIECVGWAEVVQYITGKGHDTSYPEKGAVSAFSPVEYVPGTTRADDNILAVHFGALDFDKIPRVDFDKVLDSAAKLDLACIVYTTWSHGNAGVKNIINARVVFPFSQPVTAERWGSFWPKMNEALGGLADINCKNLSRLYFLPSTLPETLPLAEMLIEEGKPLDVAALQATPLVAATVVKVRTTDVLDPIEVEALAAELARKQNPHLKALGACLGKVLKGEPWAEAGQRDTRVFQLLGTLVERFPTVKAESIASIFVRSLDAIGDAAFIDEILNKIRRHQEKSVQEEIQEEQQLATRRSEDIREAFQGIDNERTHPYENRELAQWGDMRKRWILQKSDSFYLFFNGGYRGPFNGDARNAAKRDLAAAYSAGVDLYALDPFKGPQLKQPGTLVEEYGTVIERIVLSITKQESFYDPTNRTFYRVTAQKRQIPPRYNPQVDRYITLLGGPDAEILKDWLALVPDVSKTLRALYLWGQKGTGKTLIANALSRLWTTGGPTKARNVIGTNFNDSLATCPLIIADEEFPKDYRGKTLTEAFRDIIFSMKHSVNRKFQDTSDLEGCCRMVLTANNTSLLKSSGDETAADAAAINERLLLIEAGNESAKYLAEMMVTGQINQWVEGDVFAAHVLWLEANRPVIRVGRSGVPGGSGADQITRTMQTAGTVESAVCQWLCMYLAEPNRYHNIKSNQLDPKIRIQDKEFLVNIAALVSSWDLYQTHVYKPSIGQITNVLAKIAPNVARLREGETRQRYKVVNLDTLQHWNANNGYFVDETIIERIKTT